MPIKYGRGKTEEDESEKRKNLAFMILRPVSHFLEILYVNIFILNASEQIVINF